MVTKQLMATIDNEILEAVKNVCARHGLSAHISGGSYTSFTYKPGLKFSQTAEKTAADIIALKRHGLKIGMSFSIKRKYYTITGYDDNSKFEIEVEDSDGVRSGILAHAVRQALGLTA